MTLAVIDSSIVVKWIIGETDSAQALMLRRFYRFAAPDLVTAEAANAILNKVRRSQVTELEAHAAAELISQLSIEFHPMQPLTEQAVAFGLKLRHPVYDCMFLALAERLKCPMITADVALIEKSANLGVPVLTMDQAIAQA